MGKPARVTFIASLAAGRCLTFDADGGARLVLEIPDMDAAVVAAALPSLRDIAFAVVIQPVGQP